MYNYDSADKSLAILGIIQTARKLLKMGETKLAVEAAETAMVGLANSVMHIRSKADSYDTLSELWEQAGYKDRALNCLELKVGVLKNLIEA